MVEDKEKTNLPKYFEVASSLTIDTTPGFNTANVGTWFGRIPNVPVPDGTSTCLTSTLL